MKKQPKNIVHKSTAIAVHGSSDSSANKAAALDTLKAQLLADNPAPELASTATQLVFGQGNPAAAIVFIGEAPGKKEDESGEPFVGAAGRMLDQLLASISLTRSSVYITNIVKYRPPDNRDPLPSEKEAFLPYLRKQLQIIAPKVIVTLGRHSGQAFMQSLRISVDHGEPIKVQELQNSALSLKELNQSVFLPLYHPAAALYNGSLRATLFQDFMKLQRYASTH